MKIIIKRNALDQKWFTLDVEPSDTIEEVKKKILEIPEFSFLSLDTLYLNFWTKYLYYDDWTLKDYCIGENCTLYLCQGYCFYINFEGKKYKKKGPGCSCCGGHGDLFGFISSKTGISREELYLVNGSEIILDKDFDVRKYGFEEYFFKSNSNKIIKIKFEDKQFAPQFFAYRPEKLDYDILLESIAKGYISNFLNWPANDKMLERFKVKLYTKHNLIFNGKIIYQSEDLSEIENLNEIIVVKKDSNEDKKE